MFILFERKLASAFVTTSLFSLVCSLLQLIHHSPTEIGEELFLGGVFIFALYSAPIIFLYGTLVSVLIELYIEKQKGKSFFSFSLHALMGLLFGLVGFVEGFGLAIGLSIIGGISASLFFLIDRLIHSAKNRKLKLGILITPVALFIIGWISFVAITPPFTEETAIRKSEPPSGFLAKEGKINLEKEGYKISLQTEINEIKPEVFEFTYKESWKKGEELGSRVKTATISKDERSWTYVWEGDNAPYDYKN